jgi:hypothetical protein
MLGDLMRHMNQCVRYDIEQMNPEIWSSLNADADYILTHPNGWDATQQARMRQAAIYAGLVPDGAWGHSRIHFMTEGEANLHYCMKDSSILEVIKVV